MAVPSSICCKRGFCRCGRRPEKRASGIPSGKLTAAHQKFERASQNLTAPMSFETMGAVLRFRVSGRRAQTLLTETAKRFMYRQAGKDIVSIGPGRARDLNAECHASALSLQKPLQPPENHRFQNRGCHVEWRRWLRHA